MRGARSVLEVSQAAVVFLMLTRPAVQYELGLKPSSLIASGSRHILCSASMLILRRIPLLPEFADQESRKASDSAGRTSLLAT